MDNPLLEIEFRIPFTTIRAEHVEPAIELRQLAEEHGMMWLRINRACSSTAANQILGILNKDDEMRLKRNGGQ